MGWGYHWIGLLWDGIIMGWTLPLVNCSFANNNQIWNSNSMRRYGLSWLHVFVRFKMVDLSEFEKESVIYL